MKLAYSLRSATILLLLISPGISFSAVNNPADDDAEVIHLRTDCSGIENCFDQLQLLLDWTWDTRAPSADSQLLVDIGPGVFVIYDNASETKANICDGGGYVTFRGAGSANTSIRTTSFWAITAKNCESLVFQDLTLDGTNSLYGFFWIGSGSSTYTNVVLLGDGYAAWYDTDEICVGSANGIHYFYGSEVIHTPTVAGAVTYLTEGCTESWFYGSTITLSSDLQNAQSLIAVLVQGGEFHAYGSTIQVITGPEAVDADVVGIQSLFNANGNTHLHGTNIKLISDNSNITALRAGGGSFIHASESSYILKSNKIITRAENADGTGVIQAPYIWNTGSTPNIQSIHGADIAFTTDTLNGEPHIAVYSDECAQNWFDITTQTCRD